MFIGGFILKTLILFADKIRILLCNRLNLHNCNTYKILKSNQTFSS